MALALVQSKTAAGGTSVSVTLTTPATAGNLLVAMVSSVSTATGGGLAGLVIPTGFTLAGTGQFDATNFEKGKIAWKVAAGGESVISGTADASAIATNIEVYEFSGFSVWQADASNQSTQTGVLASQPGATGVLTAASEVVVAMTVQSAGGGFTSPAVDSGFTLVSPVSQMLAAYLLTAATTSLNPTFSWTTTSRNVVTLIASFRQGFVPPVPSAVPLALTEPAPTIAADANPPGDTQPVPFALTEPAPTIVSDTAVAVPSDVQMALTVLLPAIDSGTPVAISTVVPLALTEPAPTIVSDTALSVPAAVPLALTEPAPAPAGDANLTPSVVPLALSVPAPTIAADALPAPSAVPLAFSVLAPTIVVSGNATPTPVPLALTIPAPAVVVSIGNTITLQWDLRALAGRSVELLWRVRSNITPVISIPSADLLDLRFIGIRSSCFRWDVLNSQNVVTGEVHPSIEQAPTITNDVTRAIKRDMSSFVLAPSEQADINPFSDRIRPVMVLQNGDEYPMGLFLFVDGSRSPHTYGKVFTGHLMDQCFVVDQAIETSLGLQTGASIRDAIGLVLAPIAGIGRVFIDGITDVIAQPLVWPAGTSRLKIVNDLCAKAGCYDLYFDNVGNGYVRKVPSDLTTVAPTVTYVDGSCGASSVYGNIIEGSTIETDNLLSAPNRVLVIDSAAQTSPVTGLYDIPASSPNSFFNRGERIVRVITEQGLASTQAAVSRAKAAAAQSAADYSWWSFQGIIDPRHDTYNILSVRERLVREQKWSTLAIEGAPMSHDVRLAYA